MQEETEKLYREADSSGLPMRYVHEMRDTQWDYINRCCPSPSLCNSLSAWLDDYWIEI